MRPPQIAGSGFGRVVVVHGVGAAAEDDRLRPAALQLLVRGVVRQELGIDVELADAASDELGELAAEVEDHDRPGSGGRRESAGMVVGERSGAGALSAVSRYASTSASSGARTRWPEFAASPWMVLPRSRSRLR